MHRFDSDGVEIAFIDEAPEGGQGEPILLFHVFASSHMFNLVIPCWVKSLREAGRRVIALDNRGHGRSGKPHEPAAYRSAVMAEREPREGGASVGVDVRGALTGEVREEREALGAGLPRARPPQRRPNTRGRPPTVPPRREEVRGRIIDAARDAR